MGGERGCAKQMTKVARLRGEVIMAMKHCRLHEQ